MISSHGTTLGRLGSALGNGAILLLAVLFL